MTNSFNIPIVLFSFKRIEKLLSIIERISIIMPQKIYLISDGGRTPEEHFQVEEVRRAIERSITWKCDIIKHYANNNIGVYNNIAGGAKWVFEREKWAIFLEDDNLPELTFFPFCKELLERYQDDTRILWICGTNYLKEYEPTNGTSYMFTKNMMPCGWASWNHKFLKFYDGELNLLENPDILKYIKGEKYYRPLMKQDLDNWLQELRRKKEGKRFMSWDYQMSFTMRVHGLYAIVPKYNQITNIGVDMYSIHNGNSFNNEMTRRFCGLPTRSLKFPLIHPTTLIPDKKFELKIAKIITLPWKLRFRNYISYTIKRIVGLSPDESLKCFLKNIFNREVNK